MTCVAGFDLSLSCTGLAVAYDDSTVMTSRVVSKSTRKGDVNAMAERIGVMVDQITSWIVGNDDEEAPLENIDLAVIESPSFGSVGGNPHERGGLWWGVAAMLSDLRIPIATVAPKTREVYATALGNGVGKAGKRRVYQAALRMYPHVDLPDDNVADAVLLAAMGMRHLGCPIDGELPQGQLRAMESAHWAA